jgi:hypothetical protein
MWKNAVTIWTLTDLDDLAKQGEMEVNRLATSAPTAAKSPQKISIFSAAWTNQPRELTAFNRDSSDRFNFRNR